MDFSCVVFIRYLIAVILLWKLNSKVLLVSPKIDGGRVFRYLKSGKSLEVDDWLSLFFSISWAKNVKSAVSR